MCEIGIILICQEFGWGWPVQQNNKLPLSYAYFLFCTDHSVKYKIKFSEKDLLLK